MIRRLAVLFALTLFTLEAGSRMELLFETALNATGSEYLAAENELRREGPGVEPVLRRHLQHPDPAARLLAQVLLDGRGARAADDQSAWEYLEYLPARLARTPITAPSPTGIADYLQLHYGPRVANLLALHLLKFPNWPRWRVLGVLFYLREQKQASVTAALLRYAAETSNAEGAMEAVRAIQAAADPDLPVKLAAERDRLKTLRKPISPALASLLNEDTRR
jgi:hypothetical protein